MCFYFSHISSDQKIKDINMKTSTDVEILFFFSPQVAFAFFSDITEIP